MSDELKPCPFCGEMPIVHTREEGIISVECSTRRGCVNSAGWSTPEQWNSRPIEDQLKAENEKLRSENERLREGLQYIAKMNGVIRIDYISRYAEQTLNEVTK